MKKSHSQPYAPDTNVTTQEQRKPMISAVLLPDALHMVHSLTADVEEKLNMLEGEITAYVHEPGTTHVNAFKMDAEAALRAVHTATDEAELKIRALLEKLRLSL